MQLPEQRKDPVKKEAVADHNGRVESGKKARE
eukprot:CAMPEP_0185415922 /NCGR_PEP_ID=MMETSP1365-20130426/6860_1 /TAXON_ID=38817 /ORGANISM="Gephyrocapsa oceanica, Strain RCC1303" /LENGTH=31 /DNA_ID= /DNA_START= /DNA_END= /DNA_ORIENTATION=